MNGFRPRLKPYVMMTGATGLLGEYLIRDLLSRGVRLAVLVRPSRQASAAQRIETICQRWERISGRAFPRPVVLQGQLTDPGWDLAPETQRWIANNCDTLLHNAASLQFVAETPEGEPWRSNMAGTEQMLELARQWRIRHLHHVSTAYVCGRRDGQVFENQTDVGQEFGNDYEASKCAAELMVAASRDAFESVTVYRPAIITGDFKTGYTSTFHGLYAPLKIAASLLSLAPSFYVPEKSLVGTLGLAGGEEKNFVPVDWVSEAMASILLDRSCYGRTYHLTAQYRTPCHVLAEVMHETFAEHANKVADQQSRNSAKPFNHTEDASGGALARMNLDQVQKSFRTQMEIYQAYWRDDPVFDRTETTQALPELPPPAVDRECVRRLCRYALRNNFGWPRPPLREPRHWATDLLGARYTGDAGDHSINLRVLGEGGGEFHVAASSGNHGSHPPKISAGWNTRAIGGLTLSTRILVDITAGVMTLRDGVRSGAVVCVSEASANSGATQDDWLLAMERWLAVMRKHPIHMTPEPTSQTK